MAASGSANRSGPASAAQARTSPHSTRTVRAGLRRSMCLRTWASRRAGGFEGRLCVKETVATELSEHDFILQLALGERNFLPLQEVRCLHDAERCSLRNSQKFSPM